MKKLDSICSKLMHQNSAIGQQQGEHHRSSVPIDQDQAAISQESSRINKRKNFTPKIFRTCDDDEEPAINKSSKESFEFDCAASSTLSSDEEDDEEDEDGGEGIRKRRRLSPDGSDKSDGEQEVNGRNGREDDHRVRAPRSPGLLAIVMPEDDSGGSISGRSSSNRSNSLLFASHHHGAGSDSFSASPNLFSSSTAFPFTQSPSSLINRSSSSSGTNRYAQQKVNDGDSTQAAAAGQQSTATSNNNASSKNDQHSPVVSYIVRFMGNDCGVEQCRFASSREHFHCKLCNNKLFTKKEEMLRHYKWHRKREESLAYGFMRYSASDDCSHHFVDCVHNLRQTHYHCLQDSCDKVYISTSDVQMHANSHRKQAHIAKEGFQRVKGSEQCNYAGCPFTDPSNRTTHFHCLRPGCSHSFKNKADMDKHKAHHTRDEQLTRDGFKKYMKSESCSFPGCAFSRVVNHIHCIRAGCDYILHSTSQMYSHKRKHEKQDKRVNEYVAQQQAIASAFKNAAVNLMSTAATPDASAHQLHQNDTGLFPTHFTNVIVNNGNSTALGLINNSSTEHIVDSSPVSKKVVAAIQGRLKLKQYDPHARTFNDAGTLIERTPMDRGDQQSSKSTTAAAVKMESFDSDDVVAMGIDMSTLQSPIQFLRSVTKAEDGDIEPRTIPAAIRSPAITVESTAATHARPQQATTTNGRNKGDDSWKKFITRYTANDPCVPLCPLLYKDHYHCTAGEGCKMTFKSKDGVRDHAKQHEQLSQAIEHFRTFESDEDCKVEGCPHAKQLHHHCLWDNCAETINSKEPVFRRLEHHKVHEYSNQLISDSRTTQGVFAGGSTATSRSSVEGSTASTSPLQMSSGGGGGETFKRKRGRPPKYNVLDVNVNPSTHVGQSQDILVTSFKLAKGASGNGGTPVGASVIVGQRHSPHQLDLQQSSPSGQNRRGRPRTVSSPRHAAEDPTSAAAASSSTQSAATAVAVEIFRHQQAQQLQQQLELLRMWNSNLESIMAPPPPPPASSPLTAGTPTTARTEHHPNVPATKRPQFDGFTTYTPPEYCPDSLCRFRSDLHYHCRLPRCFYSSNREDQLDSHQRDFHEAFEIPDGYACYDRSYNCRHGSCQYNGQARHFHCQKAGCSAALLKFNELAAHTSKGHERLLNNEQEFTATHAPPPMIATPETDLINNAILGAKSTHHAHMVRTSGTFFPTNLTAQNIASMIGGLTSSPFQSQMSPTMSQAAFAALAQSLSPAFALYNAAMGAGGGGAPGGPSSSGLGNGTAANGLPPGLPPGTTLPYTVEQQCGRPFCKLKRRLHYHCTLCHQGFSHFDRLTVHMQKHGVVLPPILAQHHAIPPPPPAAAVPPPTKSSTTTGPQQSAKDTGQRVQRRSEEEKKPTEQPVPLSASLFGQGPSFAPNSSRSNSNQKKVKFHVFQPTMMKFSDKEETSSAATTTSSTDHHPGKPSSSTSESQKPPKRKRSAPNQAKITAVVSNAAISSTSSSHSSMQYKFVDCTPDMSRTSASSPSLPSASSIQKLIMQQQHETSAAFSTTPPPPAPSLANSSADSSASKRPPAICEDERCPKRIVSQPHYHCEKCEFSTPESTKWHVHAKQHARTDQVAALGFRKVLGVNSVDATSNDQQRSAANPGRCPSATDCSFSTQSHYHCTTCNASALNQTQMSAHKETNHGRTRYFD